MLLLLTLEESTVVIAYSTFFLIFFYSFYFSRNSENMSNTFVLSETHMFVVHDFGRGYSRTKILL